MISFLFKGLLRDRSRSFFPVLMVSAGTFLTVFLYSYMEGVIGDMVDSSARFDTGHVKITTRAYHELSDQMPNDLALLGVGDLLKKLEKAYPRMIWTPRIRFGGLLDIPDRVGETRSQGPVFGVGIDLKRPDSPEIDILNLKRAIVHGRLPRGENEILISESFAQKLGLHIGEQATLIGSTMNGSLCMHNFRVVGTIRFGVVALDKRTILADIRDVRLALDMADGASEIMGYSKDMIYTDTAMSLLAKGFNARYSNQDDEFSPVMMRLGEMGGTLQEILKMAGLIGSIIVMVFVFVMSIVLWNAGLMNGIRRYGEIGVRLAIGETKGGLYGSMIVESLCIGLIGSAIGTTIGLILSYWLQVTGFDISSMMQKSTIMVSNVMRARVTPTSYVIGFLPGLFASVLGTMAAGIGIYRRQTSQLFRELET